MRFIDSSNHFVGPQMSTNASCNNNLGQTRTSKRFTAQADDFTPGEFTIRLTVSSDTRTAMASMILIVENEAVPNVSTG